MEINISVLMFPFGRKSTWSLSVFLFLSDSILIMGNPIVVKCESHLDYVLFFFVFFIFPESRKCEMASMGMGNKPCMDLKGDFNINDRLINVTPTHSLGKLPTTCMMHQCFPFFFLCFFFNFIFCFVWRWASYWM